MSKKKLKIFFTDFWPNFKEHDNYFFNLLSIKYDLEINNSTPDVLFHSADYSESENHKNFDNGYTKKIFYTGENIKPNFEETDFSLSFENNLGDKNYRLPLWVLFINWFNVEEDYTRDQSYLINPDNLIKKNKNILENYLFCSFVASKPTGKRLEFVPKLNDIKKVHCGGSLYNNTYYPLKGRGDQKHKLNFMKYFKFNIAFENSNSHGYVTEKVLHALYTNSIPIYWGSDFVKKDFNKDKIIYYGDFENDEHLIDKIMEVNSSKKQLLEYFDQPIFYNNVFPEYVLQENILDFLTDAIEK